MQTAADTTKAALIASSLVYPYAKPVGLYRCPGNQKTMIRGVSMNRVLHGSLSPPRRQSFWPLSENAIKPHAFAQ
jgi:hypothetical protein